MIIKKNINNFTFTIQGITLGKLAAIVNALTDLQESGKELSPVQKDILNIIQNNPSYKEAI